MTAPISRRSSIEEELGSFYRTGGPPADLAGRIDSRVAAALEARRTPANHAPRRSWLLAASASLVALLVVAGGVVAQRLASDGDVTIIDGVVIRTDVIERPGLTNFGQPFWGTDIFERTPAEAADMASEKGYSIRWQIEQHRDGPAAETDRIVFSDDAPPCGEVIGGSVLEAGRIQMLVLVDDPSNLSSGC